MIYPENKIKNLCKEVEILSKERVGLEKYNTTNLIVAKNLIITKLNQTIELMQSFNQNANHDLRQKIEQNEMDIYEIYKNYNQLLKDNKELKNLAQEHIGVGFLAFSRQIWQFLLKHFFKVVAFFWFLGFVSISFYLGYAPKIGLSDAEFAGAMIIFSFMVTIFIGIYPLNTYFSFKLFSGYDTLSLLFNLVSFCFISILILSDILNWEIINLINAHSGVVFGVYVALLAIFSASAAFMLTKKDKEAFANAFLTFSTTLYFDMLLVFVLKINNPNQSEIFIFFMIVLALIAIGARFLISNSYIFNFKATIITMMVIIILISVLRGDRLIATFGLDKHLPQAQTKISN